MARYSLEELVTVVATELMAVDSVTLVPVVTTVLRDLVEYFEVDVSFLRHHDLNHRTTTLVAEWPPRAQGPQPDPLGVIAFADADATFAATEHLTDVGIVRPEQATAEYQELVLGGTGVPATSAATVPLRSGGATTGVLGFVKYGDRAWSGAEINALKAIASLLAQLQARLVAEERLRYVAYHDDLTGLANRRALLQHMEERVAAGQPGPVCILFLDVDRLKAMNDFLGHLAGDQFIKRLAMRLRDRACPDDFVARLGGDEFVIVPAGACSLGRAQATAERVQAVMNERVQLGGHELHRSVSIGIARAVPGHCTVSQWLRRADEAAITAKQEGGNAIVAYTDDMQTEYQLRNDIELHLRAAIHDGSLTVHYQPMIDLRTGSITAAEALVRWQHPTLGLLPPNVFIGVAEASNLAGELGHHVLCVACRQLAQWQRELPGLALSLAVNVSPVQLIAANFVDIVKGCLDAYGIAGHSLTLEITEHAVVHDLGAVLQTLNGLRRLGVQVAIDDFGTGYSSLAQLKALPVNTLKIDRGFVHELGTSRDDLAIVRSIVGLATAFGLHLVAEGVESVTAARTLLKLGVYEAQGHLFGRAVEAATFGAMLRAGGVDVTDLGRQAG